MKVTKAKKTIGIGSLDKANSVFFTFIATLFISVKEYITVH